VGRRFPKSGRSRSQVLKSHDRAIKTNALHHHCPVAHAVRRAFHFRVGELPGLAGRRLHSPHSERMAEKSAVTPTALSVQTKKKAPLDLAIPPPPRFPVGAWRALKW